MVMMVSMAVFVTLVPSFSAAMGPAGSSAVSVVAGLVLLLDTVMPIFIGRDNPERYQDYSKYILGYKDALDQTLDDMKLAAEAREARINEIIGLAQANIRDVKSTWPNLVRTALSTTERD